MITSSVDSSKQLTTHICIGKITFDELMTEIRSFYDGEQPPNNLWDMRDADFSDFYGPTVREIAILAKKYAPTREGGRTAFVSDKALAFGLSRMYQVFSESQKIKVETAVFKSLDEAKEWLQK